MIFHISIIIFFFRHHVTTHDRCYEGLGLSSKPVGLQNCHAATWCQCALRVETVCGQITSHSFHLVVIGDSAAAELVTILSTWSCLSVVLTHLIWSRQQSRFMWMKDVCLWVFAEAAGWSCDKLITPSVSGVWYSMLNFSEGIDDVQICRRQWKFSKQLPTLKGQI